MSVCMCVHKEARYKLFGILIKLCVDGLAVTTSHATHSFPGTSMVNHVYAQQLILKLAERCVPSLSVIAMHSIYGIYGFNS